MSRGYLALAGEGRAEIVVKKSKFIATAAPCQEEAEALRLIDRVRREFWDATHNVYAFVLGEHDEVARSSDDGEPAGTAGRPVLEVIKREQVKYCTVVVTRYFGGTLLGAAGLVRAYGSAAREGLHAAGIVRKRLFREVRFVIDYPSLGRVQNLIAEQGFTVDRLSYAERVEMVIRIPSEMLPGFTRLMQDALMGAFDPIVGEEKFGFDERPGTGSDG
ncbi:MAG: YigZ family protein [Firmicutes bacterium]|jgi:uncharacterized YigZ family protein|nr:YigZ family protein [Bacillota bacterium]